MSSGWVAGLCDLLAEQGEVSYREVRRVPRCPSG